LTYIEVDIHRIRVQLWLLRSSNPTLIESRRSGMSDTDQVRGGFTGDPAQALSVAGTSGCCGNPPQANHQLSEPAASSACCGTAAEAAAEGSCCGSTAKAGAVATGQGCCS
jgi:hypothetical protein